MMTRSRSTLAVIATITSFALPAASQAAPHEDALKACVKAFMSANFADKAPLKVLQINPQPSVVQPYPRSYSFVLTAKGHTSGRRLAQSTCTTDGSGSVLVEPV